MGSSRVTNFLLALILCCLSVSAYGAACALFTQDPVQVFMQKQAKINAAQAALNDAEFKTRLGEEADIKKLKAKLHLKD